MITLETINPQDQQLYDFFQSVAATDRPRLGQRYHVTDPQEIFPRHFAENRQLLVVTVARDYETGAIIGIADLVADRQSGILRPDGRIQTTTAMLGSYVIQPAAGRGVGTQLGRHNLQSAQLLGLQRCVAQTTTENIAAQTSLVRAAKSIQFPVSTLIEGSSHTSIVSIPQVPSAPVNQRLIRQDFTSFMDGDFLD